MLDNTEKLFVSQTFKRDNQVCGAAILDKYISKQLCYKNMIYQINLIRVSKDIKILFSLISVQLLASGLITPNIVPSFTPSKNWSIFRFSYCDQISLNKASSVFYE